MWKWNAEYNTGLKNTNCNVSVQLTLVALQCMNDQFDDYVNENKTDRNKNWPYTPDHPFGILIIGGLRSGKTNVLLNLTENQPHWQK